MWLLFIITYRELMHSIPVQKDSNNFANRVSEGNKVASWSQILKSKVWDESD